jgi:hypothetical protein
MIAGRNLRVATLGAIAAAALIGAATRLARQSVVDFENLDFDARRLEMSLGDSIGNAVIDGVVNKPMAGLRLQLAQCGDPAFVVPIPVLSVAAPQLVDRAYGLPAYRATDVYRGHIRDGFSHISRITSYVATRATTLWPNANELTIGDDYYVRAYVPSDCIVSTDAYVEWAAAVLKLGRKVARADEASKTAAARR